MQINTHAQIDAALCGIPENVAEGTATVTFTTTPQMVVDHQGLVHGGFIFGLADHAAMLAVNHPHVVLGGADVKFLKPVKTGQPVSAIAVVEKSEGKKHTVSVTATCLQEIVFKGRFDCFVLEKHVLEK